MNKLTCLHQALHYGRNAVPLPALSRSKVTDIVESKVIEQKQGDMWLCWTPHRPTHRHACFVRSCTPPASARVRNPLLPRTPVLLAGADSSVATSEAVLPVWWVAACR